MPINGHLAPYDQIEFYASSSGSGTHSGVGTPVHTHGAQGEVNYVVDVIDMLKGFEYAIGGNSQTDTWSVFYDGPGAPIGGITWTGSGWEDVDFRIVIEGFKCYGREIQIFKLQGTLKVYAKGVLRITVALDEDSAGTGPAYVPLIAIPMDLRGSCGASITGFTPSPLPSTFSYDVQTTSTATGGWRIKEIGSSSFVPLPVVLPPGDAPTMPGLCEDPGVGDVSATNTGDMTIESFARVKASRVFYESGAITECILRVFCDGTLVHTDSSLQVPPVPWETYQTTSESWSRSGYIQGIPNLSKALKRFNSDYGALLDRGEMPETTRRWVASCTINGVTSSNVVSRVVHPYQNFIRQRVSNATAAMEDTLAYPSYAPVEEGGSYSKSITYETTPTVVDCPGIPLGLCEEGVLTTEYEYPGGPNPPPTYTQSANRSSVFPNTVGTEMPWAQGHAVKKVRYYASWPNPYWGYGYALREFDVMGSVPAWYDYSGRNGQQWIYDPALPPGEQTRQRNTIVSCPLYLSSYLPWLIFARAGIPFLGISRWKTDAIDVPGEFTLDSNSSARWTSPDLSATFTHGADLVVNPSSTTCKIRFDLASYSAAPYMQSTIPNRVFLDWLVANVTQVRAYLVSISGDRTLLEQNPGDGFTTKAVTYTLPRVADSEYAGSYAQDYGVGVASVVGTDSLPEGRSATAMGDAEQIVDFMLTPTGQAEFLDLEVDVADVNVDFTLKYPRFLTADDPAHHFHEARVATALCWPDGPGVRFGQNDFYVDGFGLQNPPLINAPGDTPTIIDWLCFRRVMFQGVAYNGGTPSLTTELTQLYDTYEGQSVGQVDKHSLAFILPTVSESIRTALVNSVAECPPIAIFPRRQRDASTWLESGAWCTEVWSWAQLTRWIVCANGTLHLWNADETVQLTSVFATPPSGWRVTWHQAAVDNQEGATFLLKNGAETIAEVSPWDGYLVAFKPAADPAASGLANARSREGFYAEADTLEGNLRVSFVYGSGPNPSFDHASFVDKSNTCTSPSLVFEERRLWIGYVREDPTDSFNVYVRYSDDDAITWSAEESVSTGVAIELFYDEDAKLLGEVTFRYDSGSSGPGKLYGKTRYAGDSAWSSEFTITDGTNPLSVKDQGFDILAAKDAQRAVLLVCVIDGETDRSTWISFDDARTFKRL